MYWCLVCLQTSRLKTFWSCCLACFSSFDARLQFSSVAFAQSLESNSGWTVNKCISKYWMFPTFLHNILLELSNLYSYKQSLNRIGFRSWWFGILYLSRVTGLDLNWGRPPCCTVAVWSNAPQRWLQILQHCWSKFWWKDFTRRHCDPNNVTWVWPESPPTWTPSPAVRVQFPTYCGRAVKGSMQRCW